jgi:hypothetical protein
MYRIYGTETCSDIDPRREWVFIKEVVKLKTAVGIAKKSSLKKWHEIEITGFDDDGELVYHSYYQKGKLEINMYP